MPAKIVLGAQWGDEGKAKVVDYLTQEADVVVRFQGGANAGHTVKVGDAKFVFHVIPAGILQEGKKCAIGNGVVLDPQALLDEIDELAERDISTAGRLLLSQSAHLVMPYHIALEKAQEERQRDGAIGTTLRGIGPCYRDKIERLHGLRAMDLLRPDALGDKVRAGTAAKNEILTKIYAQDPLDPEQILDQYLGYAERLGDYIGDTSLFLNQALDQDQTVLFEGAQGTLLDVDHGTYPFVTSSNTTAGGACTGTGIGPTRIDEVIGVTKAYTTRVGNGPFPTELENETGERIRELGQEYGATTGRRRRCGWFDGPILRRAASLNGLTSIALTRLDVLDTLESLQVCVGYRCQGELIEEFPADPLVLAQCEPVYEELAGWCSPTTHVRRFADLPANARAYVERLSALSGVPTSLVSVGPERAATIPM
ncbi:MAG: adenylosuccinate synthase [Candidatus Latescibacteria bacterium]|nr:adenylosuccinate synthase [Candidatus Latescibacterota bacterium]